ncbi:hypothetical protein [Nitrosomonas sp.]|uniref:hypothetical protein n=1 Tax=Nitrosomonas sp. TaxID=42353 RepID=UPI001D569405|nr:hypothetical protein [Nitrosomonas sp.]MBX3617442.1 hypothetical protein [Nitrosomonas sp.]
MADKHPQENAWFYRGNITSISAAVIIAIAGSAWGALNWEKFTLAEKTILIVLVISVVTIIGILVYYFFCLKKQFDVISKKLESVEEPRRYDNWDQVQPRIRELISDSFIHSELTELQCVGVALHVSWKTVRECLENHLEKYKTYPNVKICLKVLRKDSVHWEKMGVDWKRRNNSFYDGANLFCNQIKGVPNVSLHVYDYEYTPNWHGVLINKSHLFRSSCLYRNNEFTVHKNPYVYFLAGANNYSNMQIDEFQYWFQFGSREIIKNYSHE